MSLSASRSLFRSLAGREGSSPQIFWFPHAGAGTASLVRPAAAVRGAVSLRAARLPGREERIGEPPYRDLDALVDDLARELVDHAQTPFALVGHSFGALVAYSLARRLASLGRSPQLLQVMAALPPDRSGAVGPIAAMSDGELTEHLDRHFGGIPAALRDDPESLRYFLPAVRAELEMMESFRHEPDLALDVPLVAMAGTEDRVVPPEAMLGWKRCTTRRFAFRSVAGGHFFPIASLPAMVQAATAYLESAT